MSKKIYKTDHFHYCCVRFAAGGDLGYAWFYRPAAERLWACHSRQVEPVDQAEIKRFLERKSEALEHYAAGPLKAL